MEDYLFIRVMAGLLQLSMTKQVLIALICLSTLGLAFTTGKIRVPWAKVGDCNNFDNQNSCQGQQTDNDASWANRSFQTPPRGDTLWR